MNHLVLLKVTILALFSLGLSACGDQPEKIVESGNLDNRIEFSSSMAKTISEKEAARHNLSVNESIVGVQMERLQISAELHFDEQRHSSVTRFAEIAGQNAITQLESTVYIDKASIKGKARVYVGLELGYQLEKYRGDRKNMTVIQNVMKNANQGFIMTGRAIGCREGGCTVFDEAPFEEEAAEESRFIETRGRPHNVSLRWDDEFYRFVFSFDGMTSYIDMVTFASKYDFNPKDFSFARLFATIENIKNDHDEGRVVARFGNVNVNRNLYDDFSAEALNPEKWATGQTYR